MKKRENGPSLKLWLWDLSEYAGSILVVCVVGFLIAVAGWKAWTLLH